MEVSEENKCPQCGGELIYVPPQPAEPEVGITKWNGGVTCLECQYEDENEPEVTPDYPGDSEIPVSEVQR